METATALRSSFGTCFISSNRTDYGCSRSGSMAFVTVSNKGFCSLSHPKVGLKSVSFRSNKKRSAIKASSSSDSAGPTAPIAPLQLESPIGQFLSQILISHPHLVPAAVEQQLEQLQTDRDAQKQNEEPSAASTDLVLYRNYVMSFDPESLQRYATIRSKEAVSIIEKHTEALFGRPEIVITPEGTVDSSKDEVIKISFGGLRRLVLEAVTFGSFLWDVESYVDSRYHFVVAN
ncbi:hypothetical protein E3N88_20671 [Mikania micrantha]|uniref:Uncharacterized protein n=1 Tax=Mikania micrantha TaxID=192012 RepID=A0A5N6NKG9_9ASTR|nr:hypothetical protein E3N88_20671 [Mikania micrantha]